MDDTVFEKLKETTEYLHEYFVCFLLRETSLRIQVAAKVTKIAVLLDEIVVVLRFEYIY